MRLQWWPVRHEHAHQHEGRWAIDYKVLLNRKPLSLPWIDSFDIPRPPYPPPSLVPYMSSWMVRLCRFFNVSLAMKYSSLSFAPVWTLFDARQRHLSTRGVSSWFVSVCPLRHHKSDLYLFIPLVWEGPDKQ
jgi:hypothetical protein